MHLRLGAAAAWLACSTAACDQARDIEDRAAEEVAVYVALLEGRFSEGAVVPLEEDLLDPMMFLGSSPPDREDRRRYVLAESGRVDAQAYDDLLAVAADTGPTPALDHRADVAIVTRLPSEGQGVYSLSRVGFDEGFRSAAMVLGYTCGMMCGGWSLVAFRWDDDAGWTEQAEVNLAVSR